MPSQSFAFKVAGVEPSDPSFRAAGDATKQAFWQAAAKWVEAAMDKQLADGLDKDGNALVPIAESTRKKGRWRSYTGMGSADAPPLTPAYGMSRTRALFDARAHWREGYVLGFWRTDSVTGRQWGEILGIHRAGAGRLPVRDVIGLSPAFTAWVKAQGEAWWKDHLGKAAREFTPPIPVRPIAATGRVDLRNFTFGIQASEERTARAIAAGFHTGFRQRGQPPQRGAAAPVPKPTPAPAAFKPPGRAAASPEAGLKFTKAYQDKVSTTTVQVDVAKLNAELAKDAARHVGPGGTGAASPGNYAAFVDFLARAKAEGIAIEQPRIGLDAQGKPTVTNGRHRFAVLRDLGATEVPISVPRGQAARFKRLFGAR